MRNYVEIRLIAISLFDSMNQPVTGTHFATLDDDDQVADYARIFQAAFANAAYYTITSDTKFFVKLSAKNLVRILNCFAPFSGGFLAFNVLDRVVQTRNEPADLTTWNRRIFVENSPRRKETRRFKLVPIKN